MRTLITICSLILFLVGCEGASTSQQSNPQGKRELVPNPEKYAHDGYDQLPDSLKPEFVPDIRIGDISLLSKDHVTEYLGEDIMDRLVETSIPNTTVHSSTLKQQLTIYFHPGNVSHEFSEFRVKFSEKTSLAPPKTYSEVFETESKIKLEMTMGALRAIKGEPHSITNTEMVTFHYRIDDEAASPFLQQYGMPVYYADYSFVNGYLVEFRFGFEYP